MQNKKSYTIWYYKFILFTVSGIVTSYTIWFLRKYLYSLSCVKNGVALPIFSHIKEIELYILYMNEK